MLPPSTGYSLDENIARRNLPLLRLAPTHPQAKNLPCAAWSEKPHTYANWCELNFGNEWRQDMISFMLLDKLGIRSNSHNSL
jgi:hypothetical protein